MSTNSYDRTDIVRREKVLIAGPMKIGAYRVRKPDTDEFGELQFHMTYDNMVMCVMPASAVKMLVSFVQANHKDELALDLSNPDRVKELLEHNTTLLEETRAQRRTIAEMEARLAELLP